MSGWTVIEHKELASNQVSIDFTNIPQDGTDLALLCSLRSDSSSGLGNIGIGLTINGVSTNRTGRWLYGGGTLAGSTTFTGVQIGAVLPTSTSTSNTFSNGLIYFPNYAGNTNKSFSVDNVAENNNATAYEFGVSAGLWSSTAPITSLSVREGSVGNLVIYSSVTLYKITKGSNGGVTVS